jgi:hypothetical protein
MLLHYKSKHSQPLLFAAPRRAAPPSPPMLTCSLLLLCAHHCCRPLFVHTPPRPRSLILALYRIVHQAWLYKVRLVRMLVGGSHNHTRAGAVASADGSMGRTGWDGGSPHAPSPRAPLLFSLAVHSDQSRFGFTRSLLVHHGARQLLRRPRGLEGGTLRLVMRLDVVGG